MIDLRSDTVTKPTISMRKAMMDANVGDDVFGDDPTVNELQQLAADKLGFEAGLFTCSGTQANLIALLSHCQRGDEYIVGQEAHNFKWEGGGAAVLGGIQPQPIEHEENGSLSLKKIKKAIKPINIHFAKTKLISIENTHHGKVLPLKYLDEISKIAQQNRLYRHLDGARAFNAAVKQQVNIKEITKYFDTVSICLSKGLAAPIGSILCGNREFIENAIRWRKVCGGGMRQAGILAAAGILSLTEQVDHLQEDHEHAMILGESLNEMPEFRVDLNLIQTNMVFARLLKGDSDELSVYLRKNGIIVVPDENMRFVFHKDIKREDVDTVIKALKDFFTK